MERATYVTIKNKGVIETMSSIERMGTKDKELYAKAKTTSLSFIDQLKEQNFLKTHITIEEDSLIRSVLDRVNAEGISVAKLERLITSNKLDEFLNSINPFGINGQDIMNYYSGLLIHQILDVFELFKKYLMTVLDKKQLSLSGKEALGYLLNILDRRGINHGFDEFIDKDLRNALGHSWYWFQNNIFYYVADPDLKKTKSLTLAELFIKMRESSLLLSAFLDNAFERILELDRK